MSMREANLGDVYEDRAGNMWRIIGICQEPTVYVECVGRPGQRKSGGISGLMWDGFRRVLEAVQDEGRTP